MQKILIVGSSGLVGKNFFNMLNKKYRIDNIDKHNVNKAKEIISNNHYDFLIYLALSKEYKSNVYTPPLLRELFETEDMQQNRQRYATNLFSLITLFPEDDLAIYLSSEMKIELENQSEFPTTEQ